MNLKTSFEKELKESYLTYALSIIISRAIPDVRDGLKPVQRRVLYAMNELGLQHNKPYKKSARIVGEVLGKYHPHGDAPIYEALVRLAQDFVMRYPLIDGQGNFGSIDNDPPAAMRYTEARLSSLAGEFFVDLPYETVDFVPNFDNTLKEPVVLPVRFPNLLVNGASGIAVGMMTLILPHNLREVIDGLLALMDGKDPLEYIKGPDFPTGGIVINPEEIKKYLRTGHGLVKVRAKAEIKGRSIIITEIPYQVSKARILGQIAEKLEKGELEGIEDIIDKSDKRGIEIEVRVVEGYDPEIVLSNLYAYTDLLYSYPVNQVVLAGGRPKRMSLIELLQAFLDFRREVVKRRTQHFLKKAKDRVHILEGLLKAISNVDQVLEIMKNSETRDEALNKLTETFSLSEKQATAILDMRIAFIIRMEVNKLKKEKEELEKKIAEYEEILRDRKKLDQVIRNELIEIKEKYGDERKTKITAEEIREQIQEMDVVVVWSSDGYLKRIMLSEFKEQKRGGHGLKVVVGKDPAGIKIMKNTADAIILTKKGRLYVLPVLKIPRGDRYSKGIHIEKLLKVPAGDKIAKILELKEDADLFILTKMGYVKRISVSDVITARKAGVTAVTVRENDVVVDAVQITDGKTLVVSSADGYAVRFSVEEVRAMGRMARGVIAIKTENAVSIAKEARELIVISSRGCGKRIKLEELPIQKRGGKGVVVYKGKCGTLVKILPKQDVLTLLSSNGKVIRMLASEIPIQRRYSVGVRVMKLEKNASIVDAC